MLSIPLKTGNIWENLRERALYVACSNPLYHWFISSGDCPQQLKLRLTDPWPGKIEIGQMMCRGILMRGNINIKLNNIDWNTINDNPIWGEIINNFSWLRDLRANGGDASRILARQLFEEWMCVNDRWSEKSWRADIMGQRIVMWLSFFDFFCSSADEKFQRKYFSSLNAQARHLSRVISASQLKGVELFHAAQGLIYAGLCLPDRDEWIVQGFQIILNEIQTQINKDGTHISGSPEELLKVVQVLLDLRYALNRAELPVPSLLQQTIELIGPALRFFIYPDRKLALFHGGQEGDSNTIDAVLTQLHGSRKSLRGASLSGIERITQGRAIIMLDAGSVPIAPYDRSYHSAPLSFEFIYGRERIMVNCGGHPTHEGWTQGLRHTAAHNTIIINNKPVHDFAANGGIINPYTNISLSRHERKNACLIDASHDSFIKRSGIKHSRRIFLTDDGHDLRGEDTIIDEMQMEQSNDITIRFHLHPRVLVSPIDYDEDSILLTLPAGSVWRFHGSGAKLSVEPSVYLGIGLTPIPTKQLILNTKMTGKKLQVKWALQRESN